MLIAVDGPAAAGKGTLCGRLADMHQLAYLDTGLLYRAVGMNLLRRGVSLDGDITDAAVSVVEALTLADMQQNDLRSLEAGSAASKVSAIPAVREGLLKFQRDFATHWPNGKQGAILDGRDIGTVILPDAPIKLYLTASAEVRAHRRFMELDSTTVTYETVLAEVVERDNRDAQRSVAPMKPADDALVLDTSELSAAEVLERVTAFIASKSSD